jgi:hypothetical protein
MLSSKPGLQDTVEGGKSLHRTNVRPEKSVSPATVRGVTFPDARIPTHSEAFNAIVSKVVYRNLTEILTVFGPLTAGNVECSTGAMPKNSSHNLESIGSIVEAREAVCKFVDTW